MRYKRKGKIGDIYVCIGEKDGDSRGDMFVFLSDWLSWLAITRSREPRRSRYTTEASAIVKRGRKVRSLKTT